MIYLVIIVVIGMVGLLRSINLLGRRDYKVFIGDMG